MPAPSPWWPSDASDVLSDVVTALGLAGSVQVCAEMSGRWAVRWESSPAAMFHTLEEGSGWLRAGDALLPLATGDVALVRPNTLHEVVREPSIVPQSIATASVRPPAPTITRYGAPGPREALLVCGAFHFAAPVPHPLLSLLPPVVHLRAGTAADAAGYLRTLRRVSQEAAERRPGADVVVRRLTDVLFVELVRAWFEEEPAAGGGWLAALNEPAIGQSIVAIHDDPGRAWTVEELARAASLSRSTFSARFTAIAGEPPMAYLTRWRMLVAARALASGDASVAHVAERVGYHSEASFSRAFKRHAGMTPGAVRRPRRVSATTSDRPKLLTRPPAM